jgi:hypothetical protein
MHSFDFSNQFVGQSKSLKKVVELWKGPPDVIGCRRGLISNRGPFALRGMETILSGRVVGIHHRDNQIHRQRSMSLSRIRFGG